MAVEQISESQKQLEEKTKEICQMSIYQKAQELADDAAKIADQKMKEAQQKLNEANLMLAKLPEDAMNKLKAAEEKLWQIIAGLQSPDAPNWDGKVIVAELEKLLNPVIAGISSLSSVGVPEIPGLKDIMDLLMVLTQMMNVTPEQAGLSKADLTSLVPKKPDLPTHLLDTLTSLVNAIQTLCSALPMVLINLIFDMIAKITDMFMMIQGVIGVPPIPPPLTVIAQCPKIGKDVYNFVTNAPGKISNVVEGVVKEKLQLVSALKHPALPTDPPDLKVPEELPSCPQRT